LFATAPLQTERDFEMSDQFAGLMLPLREEFDEATADDVLALARAGAAVRPRQ
jgi:hypothetical protein